MAGTLIRRVLLQINADDGDAEAKLEAIALKADELRDKHPELKVRIDTAEAQAKMAVLRAELKDMSAQADAEAAKGGILSRFLGGSTGNSLLSRLLSGGNGKSFLRGFGSVFGKIPGLPDFGGGGGAGEAGAEGGGDLGGVGVGAGIFTLVPTVGALLVELDGLVSGFAAAGAGAGAFGLLALPAFKSVSTAYTQINTDQQAYNRALTAAQRSTALAHLKQDYANLSGPQKDAVNGIQSLVGQYHKLSAAFTPEAFKVFSGFLKLANDLLPDITPFAKTFADSLSGLLAKADKFAGSKGFKDWLKQFQGLEGPSITAIGNGLGHLATTVGKLLTIMSKKDVVNAINIAFSILDGTLIAIGAAIKITMKIWDTFTTQIDKGRHQIAQAWDAVRHAAAELGHDIATWFDRIRQDIAQWGDDAKRDVDRVVSFFEGLPGRIVRGLGNIGNLLYQAGKNVIQGLINGITSMLGSVGSAMGGILGKVRNFLPFSPAREGPLSGSGSPDIAGRKIGLMLAAGMEQSTSAVAASNARLARAAGIGVHGGAAGGYGAAGGTQRLQLEWVGGSADQALITLLKQHIRVHGGNPSVLGA